MGTVLLILLVIAFGMAGLGKVMLLGSRNVWRKIKRFGKWFNEPEETDEEDEE